MKKLLLLLILSFFSAQSFAGSCPDGSEPDKSLSEDGTFFKFLCKNDIYNSFPVHEFAKSPLRDLKVPENWQLFKDPEELYRFHERFKGPVNEGLITNKTHVWDMSGYIDDCERGISEFDLSWIKQKMSQRFIRCMTVFSHHHFRDRKEGIKVYERILLAWAKTKPVIYRSGKGTTAEFGMQGYSALMAIGDFSSFYALYYDDFDFTPEQRQSVDNYLSDWLINHDLDPRPGYGRCALQEPQRWELINDDFKADGDYCGSNRWRMGLGAVYLGLRTNNQRLFTAGNRHIEINLAAIDKDGIFLQWARKGALALSYSRQLPEVLTLLAVAYESIGYDFYEHQLPHGKKIHEVYEAFFDFIYHPEKLNKYAFAARYYVGKDAYEFDKLSLAEKWRIEMIYPEVLAAQSKGYVIRYRPDLMSSIDYTKSWGTPWGKRNFGERPQPSFDWPHFISVFTPISGLAVYEAANQNISKMIAAEEKELAECKASELSGESKLNGIYEAKWFFKNEFKTWELSGSDMLILDQCVGKFESAKSFHNRLSGSAHPSKEFRKNLNISYNTNGQIFMISNYLHAGSSFNGPDSNDSDYNRYTNLKGDINSGQITGIHMDNGWWKIEIISMEKLEKQKANNKALLKANVEKIQAEKIAEIAKLATELSIFEIKDGGLTLTLDKVDFSETEPPQKQKKNDNSELHKAEINGSLNLSSSKQIDLKTLVFQQATDKANRLSINVGDLTPPEMNPFKRHRDTLQKKCGMGLMNQYDWLSFISETSDIKNAKNQQCHYDYFKEANDEEAFELFQAVLGGTNSILSYLQTGKSSEVLIKEEAKEIETASELSIFKANGEIFNLTLDKVDFIETGPFELERSAEYLKSWQLHKGSINGKLKTKSNGSKWFKTLVYKYDITQEQKLVIHTDSPTIKPLTRHKDSLEQKCGPKVMEWGWLSFISKTNDIKSAKNQQCIYDYFKEAKDKESLELFQAVLGGTDSILDYLQTNVEP
jgi:hypothetical protein